MEVRATYSAFHLLYMNKLFWDFFLFDAFLWYDWVVFYYENGSCESPTKDAITDLVKLWKPQEQSETTGTDSDLKYLSVCMFFCFLVWFHFVPESERRFYGFW